MKKLITCMMIASLLVLGLAGAASASPALTNATFTSTLGSNNSTTYTLDNVGTGTIWKPAAVATTITTATVTATVLGTKGTNLTFTAPSNAFFNWTAPSSWGNGTNQVSGLTPAQALAINNAVTPFIGYTGVNTSRSNAMTTAISGDTAYSSRINTALFDNLYTPAPVVLTTTPVAGAASYGLTVYPVPGDTMASYQVGQLEVWKFVPAGTALNNGAKTAVKYSLATTTSDITGTTDGQIWFTTDINGASIMSSSTTFANSGSSTYYMWMLLKDNGNFDMDGGLGVIADPPTVTPATSTSSSSSGCVYNPAAGLSLDMLFLALPALGVLVARIRRK